MPADPKAVTEVVHFINRGLVIRREPSQLAEGQYQLIQDMESAQEGSIRSRSGRRNLGNIGSPDTCHTLRKFYRGGDDATTPRYAGTADEIYRSVDFYATFTLVASGVLDMPGSGNPPRWGLSTYAAGSTGDYYAFLATPKKMLKDYGPTPYAALREWGITPAFGVARAVVLPGPGNLDGGAVGSPAGSTNYKWTYTYRNPTTANEGNPSRPMLDDSDVVNGVPLGVHDQSVQVTVYGTDDAQIPIGGENTIAIYREGGLFADGLYRLVGYASNPGKAVAAAYVDNKSDVDIEFAPILVTDNNPPVVSTLPTPLLANISAVAGITGFVTITLDRPIGAVRNGSLVYLNATSGFGGNSEQCIVSAINPGANQIGCYVQHIHAPGEQVRCDAISGQPCSGTFQAFDSVFVYGDPNNPHVLYKSKTGRPESFPPIASDGTVLQLNVGTPSNPILAGTDFRGNVLCLNRHNIFEVPVVNGQMLGATATAAQRGLYAKDAWCIADNEIYYLSYDGIYSWSGGQSLKRTEAIDQIFNPTQNQGPFNGLYPADMLNSAVTSMFRMSYGNAHIRFFYYDTQGDAQCFRYDVAYDRWFNEDVRSFPLSECIQELDTGYVVGSFNLPGFPTVFNLFDVDGTLGTTDDFTVPTGVNGAQFGYRFLTRYYDMGQPGVEKLFTRIQLEIDNTDYAGPPGNGPVRVQLLYDYANAPDVTDDFFIQPNQLTEPPYRRLVDIPLQQGTIAAGSTVGKRARAVAFFVSCNPTVTHNSFYSIAFTYVPLAELTSGQSMDYQDLGHPYDKRLYILVLTYDTGGLDVVLHLDIRAGINAGTEQLDVQSWTLNSSGKTVQNLPIHNNTIAKLIRLRTDVVTGQFLEWNWKFEQENYPADVVPFTEPEAASQGFDAYPQEIQLDVDTGGLDVLAVIQADGQNIETITVNSTALDRRRNIPIGTVPTAFYGRLWRIVVDPTIIPIGGKFQLFSKRFVFLPQDKGPIAHTYPWDDLEHPFDKRLFTITFEWELTGAAPVVLVMDTKTGINSETLNSTVETFTLAPGGAGVRSKKTFGILTDIICKLIKIYPQGVPPVGLKAWVYRVTKTEYPADIVYSTEWKNFDSPLDKNVFTLTIDMDTAGIPCLVELQNENGTVATVTHTGTSLNREKEYPLAPDLFGKMWRLVLTPGANGKSQLFAWDCGRIVDPADTVYVTPWLSFGYGCDKIARNLILQVDTGGIPATVQLQADGANAGPPLTITTSYTDRTRIIGLASNLIGKLWRIIATPGTGGKFKFFNPDAWLDYVKEPCAVLYIDTYETNFGYPGWKVIKQIFLNYQCASAVTLTILREDATVFYTATLPAHVNRDEYRFYLPTVGVAGALNKSRTYRVQLNATTAMKVYSDSRVEWVPIGIDQRVAYQPFMLSPEQQLPVG